MPASAEIEKPKMEVREIPETPEIPPEVERSGVNVRPKSFSQVKDDGGKPLTAPPAPVVVTINPPADTTTLIKQSKGSVSNSLTWLAMFWLRIIKKARHFGWKIIKSYPN